MIDAGFWRRYAAWSLDAALLALPVVLLFWSRSQAIANDVARGYETLIEAAGHDFVDALDSGTSPTALATQWLGDPMLRSALGAIQGSLFDLLWPPLLAFAVLGALYHVVFEASLRQATPGQQAFRLRVVDVAGQRVGALRALSRHVAGALSWLTLNLGHALALVSPHKRALHDMVAGTRMVQVSGGTALPAWGWAWLALQVLALLWTTAAWASASAAAMQAAFGSAP